MALVCTVILLSWYLLEANSLPPVIRIGKFNFDYLLFLIDFDVLINEIKLEIHGVSDMKLTYLIKGCFFFI